MGGDQRLPPGPDGWIDGALAETAALGLRITVGTAGCV